MMSNVDERDATGAGRYDLSESIAWRKIGGEGFLITRDGLLTHRLNPTGTRILELLIEGKASTEIAATLSIEFRATQDEIQRDVDELVGTMVARGIFVRKGDAPCR